jgi:hypothetical protein
MASILGEESQNVKVLGDDEVVFETTQPDPRSASTERRDTAVLGATGQLPEEVVDLRSEVSTRVNETMVNAVTGLQVSDQDNFEETADNLASQSAKGGDLVTLGDFFDNSFQAMKNPNLTEFENRSTIKYQLTVEKLQDAIEDNAAKTGTGTVANWFDRYILRQMPIGAFEDLTLKSTTVNNEFARAIAGDMSVQDYEVFLDTRIDEYLEQGFLFGDNPFALQDLLSAATRLGNDDNAVSDAILGAVDLFPVAGAVAKGAVRSASSINKARQISKALNNIAKSPTASTRAGAIAGPEAATEVAENIARRTDEPENLASMGPSMADPVSDKAPVRPLGEAAARNDVASEAAKDAYQYVSSALGEIYDKEALGAYITRKVEAIEAKLNKGIINQKLDYTTGKLSVIMGNPRTGMPVTKRTATRYAEDVPEATVVPIDEANNKWAVRIDEVVELDEFVDLAKFEDSWKVTDETKGNFLNRVAGSTQKAFTKVFGNPRTAGAYLRDNTSLTNLVNRGESGAVRLTQLSAPMLEKIGKVSGSDFEKIGDILARLQSGDAASTRTWFTDDQFIDLWKADNKGKRPRQNVLDAYRASVNLSDYNYIVRSTELVKSLHREGYRRISVVVGGEARFLAGKKLDNIPDDALFIDARSGAKFTKSEYDGPLVNIFETDMDVDGVKYVVDTDVVKPLEIEDAMGYNAGGPRINPSATEFVVLLDETGKPINVVLSASSPKTSRLAAEQMDALFVAAKADNLTDDLVQANNKWNTSLETREDVLKWFDENNIDIKGTKPTFTSKARDENVFTGANASVFVPNGSLEDFYTFTNKRNDKPLTHFGNGSATVNDNPLRGILNQTNTVNRSLAFSKYNDAAKVSLGQKIKQIADPNSTNKDYRSYYSNIQSWLPEDSSNEVVRKIYERKRITDLRLGGEGFGDKAVTRLADDASNLIYDLTGRKYNAGNPTHFLTNYGFKSTFLGDPFQTFLQSVQSVPIVAMAGADDGLSGMVMASNLLKSLKLEGKPLDVFLDRFADHFGYTKQEATELRQLFIDMARYEVDPSNLVEGFQTNSRPSARSTNKTLRVAGNTVNKAWEKTSNAGMYFFNKGEQITRVTAFGAAARKWGKANKGKSFLSEEARVWISNKEQAYSLNMTNMSRAQVQQGVLRVPTQFYSFMLRAFEGVFVGKDLTPSERMKLAVMLGPFWGTTGMGISNAVPTVEAINSYLPEDYKVEAGSDTYRLIKNGPVDALFAWAAGEEAPETAVSSRVGLGDGVVSTFRNYRDGSFIEQLSGAGGGKTGDTLVDFSKALGAMKRGDPVLINEEVLDLFRNFKFVDNVAKVIGMINHNAYMSKSGGVVDFKFNNLDILFTGLGIPLEEVQQVYDSRDLLFNGGKVFRAYSKEIDKRIDGYWRAVNDMDAQLANQYMRSIQMSIDTMTGLPPEQLDKLRTQVFNGFSNTTTFENVQKLRRMGLYTEAQQLLETTK